MSMKWRLREILAAAVLFLGAAAFVLWQNSRVAVLWDLSYLLDSAWRMALGQMPYRDFPFVHAPGTFLIQAALMRLAGRHYWLPIAYAAVASGIGTVVAWRILRRILPGMAAFALALPLIGLGVYAIYPHPIYDCDCALAILISLCLLIRVDESGFWRALAAGAAAVVPMFFKQNMGLPYLAAVAAGLLLLCVVDALRGRFTLRLPWAAALGGMAVALALAAVVLAATAGIGNYWHWTITFAAQRRLPGLATMLTVYEQLSFVWAVPALACGIALCYTQLMRKVWGQIAAFCLIATPFAVTLCGQFLLDDVDDRADALLALWPLWMLAAGVMALVDLRRGITLARLLPFFVLAAIHGTLLSQQLWGSTYALWPLLVILIAQVLAMLPAGAKRVTWGGAAMASVTLLVCGSLYAASLDRLNYVHGAGDQPLARSALPALRGMVARGPFLANLDELVAFAQREIPAGDAMVLFPGEDPFYFASGRVPQFPVLLFDPATDPYSAAGLMDEMRRRNVRWVVVKRELQQDDDPMPQVSETMRLVQGEFVLYRKLAGYDVWKRR